MEIIFKKTALDDLNIWKKTGNTSAQKKISNLLAEISVTPYFGTGQPEQLKHDLAGYWSRRINSEHRIIYKISDDNEITIYSLRGHYE
ncbi:MAG: Txe/YoeB family addiction module toxin [Prevotellaceae bacterium]|jgi:toxin YoeB|nr:Txe/YoeB family addiction module toxin [Prevotellaceae bacterium]